MSSTIGAAVDVVDRLQRPVVVPVVAVLAVRHAGASDSGSTS